MIYQLAEHLLPEETASPPTEPWSDVLPPLTSTSRTYKLSAKDISDTITTARLTQGLNKENIPTELFKIDPIMNGTLLNRVAYSISRYHNLGTKGNWYPFTKEKGIRIWRRIAAQSYSASYGNPLWVTRRAQFKESLNSKSPLWWFQCHVMGMFIQIGFRTSRCPRRKSESTYSH